MEMAGSNIAADIAEWGAPVALFAYVKNLPLTPVLFALVFIAIIISITTMVNAMVFTLSDMSTKAEYLKEGALSKSSSNILKNLLGLIIGLTGVYPVIQRRSRCITNSLCRLRPTDSGLYCWSWQYPILRACGNAANMI